MRDSVAFKVSPRRSGAASRSATRRGSTPVPLRGRPNAPYLVPHTMRFMAEVLGADLDELCAQVAANTERVYGSWDDVPMGETRA